MLVNTASEGESDESVVSAESEKSEKRGEKRGLVVVSCLTGIGYPPQLRVLHENFIHPRKILYTHGKFMKTFIMKPLQKFNEESPNLIRFSNIYFYIFPI